MSTTDALQSAVIAESLSLTIAPALEEKPHVPGLCEAAVAAAGTAEVIIHVRFHPDARVWDIAERPESVDKEQWFKRLCACFGSKYQSRAGGRGFFRLTRAELESAKALRAH